MLKKVVEAKNSLNVREGIIGYPTKEFRGVGIIYLLSFFRHQMLLCLYLGRVHVLGRMIFFFKKKSF